MKQRKQHNRGFSLTETMVGIVVLGITSKVAATAIRYISDNTIKSTKHLSSDTEFNHFQTFLRARVGGTKSFQSLDFRIPNETFQGVPAQSSAAGIFLAPNTDILGNAFPTTAIDKSDLLTFLVKTPLPQEVRVAQNVVPGDTSVVLQPEPGPLSLAQLFSNGDYLILTNTQRSEALQVSNLAGSSTPSAIGVSLDLDSHWFKATFNPTPAPAVLRHGYLKGDLALKGKMLRIGVNQTTQCLVMTESGATIGKWCGIRSFQVSYKWSTAVECENANLNPTPADFERSRWDILNSGDFRGYACITHLKIEITPKAHATQTVILRTNN